MRKFVYFFIAVVLLAGCTEYRQISMDNMAVAGFSLSSTSSAAIKFKVDICNPTDRSLSLESLDAVLLREGKDFVYFSLEGRPSVAMDTCCTVAVHVKATAADPISILTAGLDFSSWNLEDYVVDGKLVFRLGNMKKTVRVKKVPLEEFIKSFR